MVFSTRPAMIARKSRIPTMKRTPVRQFNTIQLTFRVTAAVTRHAPRTMKKIVDLRRDAKVTIPLYKGAAPLARPEVQIRDTHFIVARNVEAEFSVGSGSGRLAIQGNPGVARLDAVQHPIRCDLNFERVAALVVISAASQIFATGSTRAFGLEVLFVDLELRTACAVLDKPA